ncbi:MAG: sodium:proton antiporter [Deltaproteobacteria bacterium]|nr:sodium:proton antiporter [Deltaproteobacteria bacterium]
MTGLRVVAVPLLVLGALLLVPDLAFAAGDAATHGADHVPLGARLPIWSVGPFAGILLSIALFPLVAPAFWHHHYGKIAAGWAVLFGVPFLVKYRQEAIDAILHIYAVDYIPFIILLWALFTVAGGIVVRGSLKGSPKVNVGLLAIGTVLASIVGTTGASMLLIRPLMRANSWRINKTHLIVFFIFLVSNIGGSLTPLGDPPLFLGFLHSVPFFWTLHLTPAYLLLSAMLLVGFFFLDRYYYGKEPEDAKQAMLSAETEKFGLAGTHNFLYLGGVIGFVLFSGSVTLGDVHLTDHLHVPIQNLVRDFGLVGLGLLSMKTTGKALREENEFSWGPIEEVAYLFAGIFMTIIPALAILGAGEDGELGWLVAGVQSDISYFWVTGGLSSFLDNAPTYLTFFNTALGGLDMSAAECAQNASLVCGEPEKVAVLIEERNRTLLAISAGAVFMGANTYIGNAPNFMVKAIAEEGGVAMPSFFGYIIRWSLPILVPCFVVVTLVFFL